MASSRIRRLSSAANPQLSDMPTPLSRAHSIIARLPLQWGLGPSTHHFVGASCRTGRWSTDTLGPYGFNLPYAESLGNQVIAVVHCGVLHLLDCTPWASRTTEVCCPLLLLSGLPRAASSSHGSSGSSLSGGATSRSIPGSYANIGAMSLFSM